jgi:hypothetical protein
MNQYTDNLEKAKRLMTRNRDNIQEIKGISFWITDKKQADNTNRIEISSVSIRNWLKIKQTQESKCLVLPIDGTEGGFQEKGLPISSSFEYEWHTETAIERKSAGDCDCLILNDVWHFLEFKTDASSRELIQINNNRNKAEAQLAKSMSSFKEQLSEPDLKCICVIVGPDFFSYPKFNASFSRKISFWQKHKIKLIETNVSSNSSYDLDNH